MDVAQFRGIRSILEMVCQMVTLFLDWSLGPSFTLGVRMNFCKGHLDQILQRKSFTHWKGYTGDNLGPSSGHLRFYSFEKRWMPYFQNSPKNLFTK